MEGSNLNLYNQKVEEMNKEKIREMVKSSLKGEDNLDEGHVPSNISDFAKRNGILPLVKKVATWAEKNGKQIVGGTAVGKNYSTLILDITYQGSEIRIDTDNDKITLKGKPIFDAKSFKNALGEKEINEEDSNPIDTVTLEVPLLIRLLEYSKEDAKDDMDLHKVAEKLIELNVEGSALSMDSYDEIVGVQGEKVDEGMSEEEWADSKEKDRFDALDPKTQIAITKIRALLAKEKGKYKSPSIEKPSIREQIGTKGDAYKISKSGSKAMPHYVLEKPDGSEQLNMTFESWRGAIKFAHKNGLNIDIPSSVIDENFKPQRIYENKSSKK